MKKLMSNIALGLLGLLMVVHTAMAASPIPTLQSTADKIIAQLKANQPQLKTNGSIAYNIVLNNLVPLVDQQTMAQAVLGRTAWNSATEAQRAQFMKEFKTLVIRTYAGAFSKFYDQRVEFKPVRGAINGQILHVQSMIVSSTRPTITVNYTLTASGSGWKIIDFSVDGVSMIQSFHSQFANTLSQSGIAGLIKSLASYNTKKSNA